ncbi:uncharacterized protein BJ212DRAFT_215539 [Suillus subaureus]|uniref:Uncharacterized protein n=1 Tax=Suillus subaureus TaxID=48587 RepID=A0A9P7DM93_9AGAM|nr:uncharacterized protein BJ212DRAFT_215539 [Suillus subaureus]KAG1798392.1 hypothetical protein BJ212DRAFT_215539 [Suillus subaureus]
MESSELKMKKGPQRLTLAQILPSIAACYLAYAFTPYLSGKKGTLDYSSFKHLPLFNSDSAQHPFPSICSAAKSCWNIRPRQKYLVLCQGYGLVDDDDRIVSFQCRYHISVVNRTLLYFLSGSCSAFITHLEALFGLGS